MIRDNIIKIIIFLYSFIISLLLIFYLIPNIFFGKEIDATYSQVQSTNKDEYLVQGRFQKPIILKKIKIGLDERIFKGNSVREICVSFFFKEKEITRKIFNEQDIPGCPKGFLKDCFNPAKKKLSSFFTMNSIGLFYNNYYYLYIATPGVPITHYFISVKKTRPVTSSANIIEYLKTQNTMSIASWFRSATNPYFRIFFSIALGFSFIVYIILGKVIFKNILYKKVIIEFTSVIALGVLFTYGYMSITSHLDAYGGLGWDGANYFYMSLMLNEPQDIRLSLGANQHFARFLTPLIVNLLGFGIVDSFLILNIICYLVTLSLIYFILKKEGIHFRYILTTIILFSLMPLSLKYYINYSTLTDPLVNLSLILLLASIRYNYLFLYCFILTFALLGKEIFIIFPLFLFLYQLYNKKFRLRPFIIANIIPIGVFIWFLYHPVFFSMLNIIHQQDNLFDLKKSISPDNLLSLFNSYSAVFGVMFYVFIIQIKVIFNYFRRNLIDLLAFLTIFIMTLQFSDRFKYWLFPFILGFFVRFLIQSKISLSKLIGLVIVQMILMKPFHVWSANTTLYLRRDSYRIVYNESVKILIFSLICIFFLKLALWGKEGINRIQMMDMKGRISIKKHRNLFLLISSIILILYYFISMGYIEYNLNKYYANHVDKTQFGLRAFYYDNSSFSGVIEKTEVVREISYSNSTDKEFQHEDFSLRLVGIFYPPEKGHYKFFLRSDDGSRLFIDQDVIIDNAEYSWVHPSIEKYKTVFLKKRPYLVAIEYLQAGGKAELGFSWLNTGKTERIYNLEMFFHPVISNFQWVEDIDRLQKIIRRQEKFPTSIFLSICVVLFIWILLMLWEELFRLWPIGYIMEGSKRVILFIYNNFISIILLLIIIYIGSYYRIMAMKSDIRIRNGFESAVSMASYLLVNPAAYQEKKILKVEHSIYDSFPLNEYEQYTNGADDFVFIRNPKISDIEKGKMSKSRSELGWAFILRYILPDGIKGSKNMAMRVVRFNYFIELIVIVLLFLIGQKVAGILGAVLAGLLYAIFLPAVHMMCYITYYYWAIPFSVFSLFFWIVLYERTGSGKGFGKKIFLFFFYGAVMGFAAATRMVLLYLPLFLSPFILFKEKKIKITIILLLSMLCGQFLLLLPQMLVNKKQFGRFAITTRDTWHALLTGVGIYKNPFGIENSGDFAVYDYIKRTKDIYIDRDGFDAYNKACKEQAIKIIKENPKLFINNALKNIDGSTTINPTVFYGIDTPANKAVNLSDYPKYSKDISKNLIRKYLLWLVLLALILSFIERKGVFRMYSLILAQCIYLVLIINLYFPNYLYYMSGYIPAWTLLVATSVAIFFKQLTKILLSPIVDTFCKD